MTAQPMVSVALATRDGAAYLADQLGSILAQTRPVDEIVLSDDASTDATVALAERTLAETGVAVVVLRHDPPLGVTGNFEAALAAATGDVVLLSDQDDVWAPDRVARTLAAFAAAPHLLAVHGDARLVDAAGVDLGVGLLDALEVGAADRGRIHAGRSFGVLLRRNLATGATMAIRRELLERARPFPADWLHDEWLAITAAAVERLDLIEQPLVDYRQHGANAIGVTRATLGHKMARVLEPRADRNIVLARRADVLVKRLAESPEVPSAAVEAASGKRNFEAWRATLPALRLARVPSVLAAWRRGEYRRFASRGDADVLRDLLQPS